MLDLLEPALELHAELDVLFSGAPHDRDTCGICRGTHAVVQQAEAIRPMEPGHAATCVLCSSLDGCVPARERASESADVIWAMALELLSEALLAQDYAETSAPEKRGAVEDIVARMQVVIDGVQRWRDREWEKIGLPDDSRVW